MSKIDNDLVAEFHEGARNHTLYSPWLCAVVDGSGLHLTDEVVGYGSLIEIAARNDLNQSIINLLRPYKNTPKEDMPEDVRKCISKALVISCAVGSYTSAKVLVRYHADTNYGVGKKYRTPLTAAVEEGAVSVIELLLHFDADINATDKFGRTPLYRAMQLMRRDTHPIETHMLVKYLLEHGADPTIDPTLKSNPGSKTITLAFKCGWNVGLMVQEAYERRLKTASPESELPDTRSSSPNCISCDATDTKKNSCGKCGKLCDKLCPDCTKSCVLCKRAYFCPCDKSGQCDICRGDIIYYVKAKK